MTLSYREWLRLTTLLIFIAAFISYAVLDFKMVSNQDNQIAGIATFAVRAFHFIPYIVALTYEIKFDFKNLHTRDSFLSLRGLGPIPISPLNSAIASAKGAIETELSAAFPKNCTLGTRKYTLGFSDRVESKALPLNTISLLPETLRTTAKEQIPSLASLDQKLSLFNSWNISFLLILGLVLPLLPGTVFFTFLFNYYTFQGLKKGVIFTLYIAFFLAFCISIFPFIFLITNLYILLAIARKIPNIKVEEGRIIRYLWGAIGSSGVIILLAFIMPLISLKLFP